MNIFVNYLNSIHNIGGDSTGSLAEKQVKSPFFDMVKIDRKLGTYIANDIVVQNHQAFILTGHAGDGKTSILVQVLKALNLLKENEELRAQNEYADFYYVKDMSEISEEHQVDVLRKALESPAKNQTSLLISNTGPLLQAFTGLVETKRKEVGKVFDDVDRIELQSKLLLQLDQNNNVPLSIEGYNFVLVNIARVDNVSFSTQILKKILNEGLWRECQDCTKKGSCPIKNNRDCVLRQFDRVSAFIENYYRFLYENDKRMTIRQMVSHLSYALTGNLSCESIINKSLKDPLFNYNFANMFFGYWGLKEKKDCLQIKGVEQIRILNLDGVALQVDYELFVKHDYRCFSPEIQEELNNLHKKHRKFYRVADEELLPSQREQKIDNGIRKAIRRFYLMYSQCAEDSDLHSVLNQVFGACYADYQKLITEKQPKAMLRKIQDLVFKALYIKNTGFLPYDKNDLPLTLRRRYDAFQSVMLVLGKVNKNDLEIIQVPTTNCFEDFSGKQQIVLRLKGRMFPLTLPMITYFNNLISGAIASDSNPALTYGIAALDTLLIEQYGDELPDSKEDCELIVIINTTKGQEIKRFAFEENRLSIL